MTMFRTGGFELCGVCGREMSVEESVRRVEAGVPAISPFVSHTDSGLRGHAECFIALGLSHVGDQRDEDREAVFRGALEKYLGAPLVLPGGS